MVVQHNLTAMNSNRMLGITTSQQAKSSEKLSSGYRINRAADDAAGLTISEKMRKQMRGLDQADDAGGTGKLSAKDALDVATQALAAGDTVTLDGKTTTLTENAPKAASAVADILANIKDGDQVAFGIDTNHSAANAAATVKNNNDGTFTIEKGIVSAKDSLSFSLHVGADKIELTFSCADATMKTE